MLHMLSLISARCRPEKCLFRVTCNADIDVRGHDGSMIFGLLRDMGGRSAQAPPQAGYRCPPAGLTKPAGASLRLLQSKLGTEPYGTKPRRVVT